MNLIVNADKNWAIGRDNKTLFNIKRDMEFFKSKTMGHTVVMGRKTLESMPGGRPLPGRKNIVLSADTGFSCNGATVCNNGGELALLLRDIAGDVYIIGGESVYRELLPFCDTAYVTRVDAAANNADRFMVNLDESPDWTVAETSDEYEENGLKFRFVIYKRA